MEKDGNPGRELFNSKKLDGFFRFLLAEFAVRHNLPFTTILYFKKLKKDKVRKHSIDAISNYSANL